MTHTLNPGWSSVHNMRVEAMEYDMSHRLASAADREQMHWFVAHFPTLEPSTNGHIIFPRLRSSMESFLVFFAAYSYCAPA